MSSRDTLQTVIGVAKSVKQMTQAESAEEIANLRTALRVLADAADVVGVKYFDTDTMDPEVEDMQAATLGARALLSPL